MNYKEAKKILPKKEFEAFEAILMNQISRTSSAKLRQRATLARKLRDKYRDLSHHEVLEIRTRRTNQIDTDINDRRARLFQEIINCLENELDQPREWRDRPILKKKKIQKQVPSNRGEAYDRKTMREALRRSVVK